MAKQLDLQRRIVQNFGQIINKDARELIEANFMAAHDWQLVRVVSRTETFEHREEACLNPNCLATRVRTLRDGQVEMDSVIGTDPRPMMFCSWDVVEMRAQLATRLASGNEGIPF